MWEKASDEVKCAYGQEYFDAVFTGTKSAAKEAAKSVAPVIDAMEDAIVNVSPSIRYLVDGSIRLVDYNNVSRRSCSNFVSVLRNIDLKLNGLCQQTGPTCN